MGVQSSQKFRVWALLSYRTYRSSWYGYECIPEFTEVLCRVIPGVNTPGMVLYDPTEHNLVYIMVQLRYYSSVAVCSGYSKSKDSIYYCAYARTRVYVPGTYSIIHILQQQTATADVVLQLLAPSGAACFTLHTAA